MIRDDEQNPVRIDPDFIAAVRPDDCDDRHSGDWMPQFDGQGRIVFTKARASFDGRDGKTIVRLLPSGGLDPSFHIPLLGADVFLQRVQPDGKLLVTIGNQFTRLNADGTIDTGFKPELPGPDYP